MSSKTTTTQEKTQTQEVKLSEEDQKNMDKALGVFGTAGKMAVGVIIVTIILSIAYAIFFSLGAAVLSYHKYGSYFWSIINFFFAWIYYPYYAFFLDTNTPPVSAPATTETMMGGMRKLWKAGRSRKH
jgi:hypothetical protein